MNRRGSFGIGDEVGQLANEVQQALSIRGLDPCAKPGARERTGCFVEQRRACDDLDLSLERSCEKRRRSSASRKSGRDENVGVEYDAHALGATRFVLRLDRQAQGLVLLEVSRLPHPVKEVEAELPSERLLDHVAVPASRSRSLDPHGTKDAFVQGDRGASLRHIRTIAS
jgi:hypothetical protein